VLVREGDATVLEDVDADDIDLVDGVTEAALWGAVST
jgi:hypothetical protein